MQGGVPSYADYDNKWSQKENWCQETERDYPKIKRFPGAFSKEKRKWNLFMGRRVAYKLHFLVLKRMLKNWGGLKLGLSR